MAQQRLKEILAIVNDKGGVGKSTTAHNLACGLIRENKDYRVLIIDLDAQVANVSLLCGWRTRTDKHGTMYEALTQKTPVPVYQVSAGEQTYNGNLYLAPSSEDMLNVEPFLLREMNPLKVLFKLFALPVTLSADQGGEMDIVDAFDYIIIDCPPAMNLLTKNAMSVASGIIIPMQLEALPTFGSSSVIKWAQDVRAEINPNLDLRGLLKVMVDKRTKASAGFSQHIDEEYGDYVFKTEIPRRTKIVEAQSMMQDIFTYAPDSDAAKSYEAFAKEIISTYKE
jgi:chromosome partitioning protein